MQSRGFQIFVLIMGGLILIFSAIAGFTIHDSASLKFLPIFGILYVLYAILFFTKGRKKHEEDAKKPEKKSPLMRR